VRWQDDDPGLPIKFGPCANDEYPPLPLSPLAKEAVRRARAVCEDNARRTGMSRREFLLSVCGAATTLLVLDACSKDEARSRGTRPGGTFEIPKEATTEPEAARGAVGGEEVVFDVQGHLLDYTIDPASRAGPFFGGGFPQARCGEADPHDCFSIGHFLEEVFVRSDTTMAVLSAIPVAPEHSPESIAVRERARQVAHALCHDDRLLVQGEAHPTLSPLPAELAAMEAMAREHRLVAWKVYTSGPGAGWWLDDHEAAAPKVGEAFIRKVVDLGIPRICVHKGIGGRYTSPEDIGPAARSHRDVAFVVYHSGWQPGVPEGPYSADGQGVDRLIASLQRAGIGPNQNVYAELGSTWWNLMRSPTEAAHVLGKLLHHVGDDNVLWGTDSIWYGSPQDQIQAFRTFEISAELQERHGYPALTKERKAKVLGANALRLHGLRPISSRCRFSRADLEQLRVAMPGGNRTYGPAT
jgi:uncharacterized protein